MLALGLILLLLAAAIVVAVVVTGTSQEIIFNSTVGDVSTRPVWVFVAGALAMLLAWLGLSLFGRGTRRRVARRREMKRLRKVEKQSEKEHVSGPIPTSSRDDGYDREAGEPVVTDGPAVRPAAQPRAGYDEPDRQLVREPRPTTSDASAGEGMEPLDDSGRHREP
jgi:uncharacterized membrane protein YciS (DUF1049 family)